MGEALLTNALKRLKELRDTGQHCSDEVVSVYNRIIGNSESSLGANRWLILEQVMIASLDVKAKSLSTRLYELFNRQFTGSQRLRRMEARIRESQEQYDEAEAIYRSILDEDPVCSATLKRLIALQTARNKPQEAVTLLNQYLESNTMDFEAWLELCDNYLSQSDYEKAAFCMEEIILSHPHNHLYHQRYAEIKYSQGDYEAARTSFTQASVLSPRNMRALLGIALCAQKLVGKSKFKVENIKIAKASLERASLLCEGTVLDHIAAESCTQLFESVSQS